MTQSDDPLAPRVEALNELLKLIWEMRRTRNGSTNAFYARDKLFALADALTLAPATTQEGAQWTCFHCNETFTTKDAAQEHFGIEVLSSMEEGGYLPPPACSVDIKAFRQLEEDSRVLRYENQCLDEDARRWEASEAERIRRIGYRQWWQVVDSLKSEHLAAEAALLACTQERDEARAQLAHWQICSLCGYPMDAPGSCPTATNERIVRLEAMHDETLTRAEVAERERDTLKAAQQWQPIETAPKDGRLILAYPSRCWADDTKTAKSSIGTPIRPSGSQHQGPAPTAMPAPRIGCPCPRLPRPRHD